MDDLAQLQLEVFIRLVAQDEMYAVDWRRFYDFIIAAHIGAIRAASSSVRAALQASTLAAELADGLADVFDHGSEILQRYQGQRAATPEVQINGATDAST